MRRAAAWVWVTGCEAWTGTPSVVDGCEIVRETLNPEDPTVASVRAWGEVMDAVNAPTSLLLEPGGASASVPGVAAPPVALSRMAVSPTWQPGRLVELAPVDGTCGPVRWEAAETVSISPDDGAAFDATLAWEVRSGATGFAAVVFAADDARLTDLVDLTAIEDWMSASLDGYDELTLDGVTLRLDPGGGSWALGVWGAAAAGDVSGTVARGALRVDPSLP